MPVPTVSKNTTWPTRVPPDSSPYSVIDPTVLEMHQPVRSPVAKSPLSNCARPIPAGTTIITQRANLENPAFNHMPFVCLSYPLFMRPILALALAIVKAFCPGNFTSQLTVILGQSHRRKDKVQNLIHHGAKHADLSLTCQAERRSGGKRLPFQPVPRLNFVLCRIRTKSYKDKVMGPSERRAGGGLPSVPGVIFTNWREALGEGGGLRVES